MQSEISTGKTDSLVAHPLAELLSCSPAAGNLLNSSTRCIDFDTGDVVFRQAEGCKGLYLVISGQYQRKVKQLHDRLTLGLVRAGELVELGAALGDGLHTYTLSTQVPGAMLLMPIESLRQTFQTYPPLRMQLLQELAREVSRSYSVSCQCRVV